MTVRTSPFGQGETPIVEVLQLMKKNKWKFQACIEYEYTTPPDSTVMTEIGKCVEYCEKPWYRYQPADRKLENRMRYLTPALSSAAFIVVITSAAVAQNGVPVVQTASGDKANIAATHSCGHRFQRRLRRRNSRRKNLRG